DTVVTQVDVFIVDFGCIQPTTRLAATVAGFDAVQFEHVSIPFCYVGGRKTRYDAVDNPTPRACRARTSERHAGHRTSPDRPAVADFDRSPGTRLRHVRRWWRSWRFR